VTSDSLARSYLPVAGEGELREGRLRREGDDEGPSPTASMPTRVFGLPVGALVAGSVVWYNRGTIPSTR
jgi:hypothetical protein